MKITENFWVILHQRGIGGGCTEGINGGSNKASGGSGAAESADLLEVGEESKEALEEIGDWE